MAELELLLKKIAMVWVSTRSLRDVLQQYGWTDVLLWSTLIVVGALGVWAAIRRRKKV